MTESIASNVSLTERPALGRRTKHVLAVLALSLLLRVFLFEWVGMWGDFGFYVYDSRLMLRGQRPFIDFLGRSPLFLYALTAVRSVIGRPILLPRAFVVVWWLLTIPLVYAIADHIRGHQAGLAAAVLFGLSPFSLVYGMWTNTQPLAAFLATFAILVVLVSDRDAMYAVAGGLFALAYLSRRSVFVIAGGVGLWLAYRWWHHRDTRRFVTRAALLGTGGTITLIAGYAAIAAGDPQQTLALLEVHTVNLFMSYGRGGYPLITIDAPIVTNQVDGRIPIFNDLCQVCGEWTARTFAKTLLLVGPTVGILGYYWRDWSDRWFTDAHKKYLAGILGALTLYALGASVLAGYIIRPLYIVAMLAFAVVAFRSQPLDPADLYDRELALPLLVLVGLTAGYLYRNRVLHTYYFMDFWPLLSVVAGVLYVRAWPGLDTVGRVLLVVAVLLSAVVGGAGAHPFTNVAVDDNEDGWFTVENLRMYQHDINSRTEPGDLVVTSSPAFLAGSHAHTLNDKPRIHMVAIRYKDHGPAVPLYRDLIRVMRSGEAEYLIYSRTMRQMMRWNESAAAAYTENYCRVAEADRLYQRANAYLYRYQPNDCPEHRQPRINQTLIKQSQGFGQVARGAG